MKLAIAAALALPVLLYSASSRDSASLHDSAFLQAERASAASAQAALEPAGTAIAALPERTFRVGDLVVARPWSRPPPGGAKVIAGYMRVTNMGAAADRLIGGSTPIAGRVEIHASTFADGVMRMRRLSEGIEIPPGETVVFKPGGRHLMLADLTQSTQDGAEFPATLIFEKAGSVHVEFAVGAFAEGADEAAP